MLLVHIYIQVSGRFRRNSGLDVREGSSDLPVPSSLRECQQYLSLIKLSCSDESGKCSFYFYLFIYVLRELCTTTATDKYGNLILLPLKSHLLLPDAKNILKTILTQNSHISWRAAYSM